MSAARHAPIYLSHGSPMTALEPGETGPFWSALGGRIDRAAGHPAAIVAISAHTLTREPVLLAAERHPTVHDFYGFPDALYELNYDCPGASALAPRVAALIRAAGLPVQISSEGGIDHGIWSPLRFVYPAADIPILPLGFPPDWSPRRLYALGAALAPLADEGVLLMGTGSLTHNLGLVFGNQRPAPDAPEIDSCAQFRRWFAEHGQAADWEALLDYRTRAPHAALMHPSDEHLLPFYVAGGAGGRAAPALRLHASVTYGCLAMDAYAFGDAANALMG